MLVRFQHGLRHGGCARETFGSVGLVYPGFQPAYSCHPSLGNEWSSFNPVDGASPCSNQHQIPPKPTTPPSKPTDSRKRKTARSTTPTPTPSKPPRSANPAPCL